MMLLKVKRKEPSQEKLLKLTKYNLIPGYPEKDAITETEKLLGIRVGRKAIYFRYYHGGLTMLYVCQNP